jgi:hypothetical protein
MWKRDFIGTRKPSLEISQVFDNDRIELTDLLASVKTVSTAGT